MEESNKSQHVLTTTKQHLQFHRIVEGGVGLTQVLFATKFNLHLLTGYFSL